MSQIGADTAQMRSTIAALRQGANSLQEAFQQANQAMQSMQGSRWSGQNRVQAEQRWEQIQAQFTPTIEVLDHLATRTERLADALDEAGQAFGGGTGNNSEGKTIGDLIPGFIYEPNVVPDSGGDVIWGRSPNSLTMEDRL
jgi:uncharacterized protein YukE